MERRLVQEAVLLAETVAAVEASKSTTAAEEVQGITCVYIGYVNSHRYEPQSPPNNLGPPSISVIQAINDFFYTCQNITLNSCGVQSAPPHPHPCCFPKL